MPKTRVNQVQKILPLFATLFVVAGIAAIALLRPTEKADVQSNPPSASLARQTMTVVRDNVAGMQFWLDDGTSRGCPEWKGPGIVRRFSKEGVVISTLNDAWQIGLDCEVMEKKPPIGVLNPSGSHGATYGAAKSDGAGVVVFSDGKNNTEIVLRDERLRPYQWPEFEEGIVDWMDDGRLAVVVLQGDKRFALAVDPAGGIVPLVTLPEEPARFDASDGAFWYATVTPGPGIEIGPLGPSVLHRVKDGKDQVVARHEDAAIDMLTTGPHGEFAFIAAGTLFAGQEEGKENVGTGRPLGWTDDGTLLVGRNGLLTLVHVSATGTASIDTRIPTPDSTWEAWRVTLDEQAAGG